jgi:hypothetical protein
MKGQPVKYSQDRKAKKRKPGQPRKGQLGKDRTFVKEK